MESGLLLEYPPVRLNSMSYKTTYLRDITEIVMRDMQVVA